MGSLLAAGEAGSAAEHDRPPLLLPSAPEAGLAGAAAERLEAVPLRPADLNLVWFDPTHSLPRGFEAVAAEVRSLFRGLGVETAWREGGGYGEGPVPEVPVILLARDPIRARAQKRVLGLVIRDQEPQRAVWIFLENVRLSLGLSGKPGRLDPRRDAQLARAVARVTAHEVIHAIAPEEPHAEEGLMRNALGRSFLTAERAAIDARCAASFVERLAALGQERAARSTVESLDPIPR